MLIHYQFLETGVCACARYYEELIWISTVTLPRAIERVNNYGYLTGSDVLQGISFTNEYFIKINDWCYTDLVKYMDNNPPLITSIYDLRIIL